MLGVRVVMKGEVRGARAGPLCRRVHRYVSGAHAPASSWRSTTLAWQPSVQSPQGDHTGAPPSGGRTVMRKRGVRVRRSDTRAVGSLVEPNPGKIGDIGEALGDEGLRVTSAMLSSAISIRTACSTLPSR